MTGNIRNGSMKDVIYQQINDSIHNGNYTAGSIINEKSLIKEFAVSKSPVREALLELCYDGVLRSIPRYGYEVVRLTREDEKNTREFRIALESGSLDLYWDRISSQDIEALLKKLQEDKTEDITPLEQWRNNVQFHLGLNFCLRNEFSYRKLEEALQIQTRAYNQFYMDQWHRDPDFSTQKDHEQILKCILNGYKEQTLALLKQDILHDPV